MRQVTGRVMMVMLAAGLWVGGVAVFAKSDNAGGGNKTKSAAGSETKGKKSLDLNFEQPSQAAGKSNAALHEAKIKEVTKSLDQVRQKKQERLKSEAAAPDVPVMTTSMKKKETAAVKRLAEVAAEEEATVGETSDAIEAVEGRSAMKTFFAGTDYKNLGQLRSSLVHNRNQIRMLTSTLAAAQTEEEKVAIQTQLQTLMQERERIKTVITENEGQFSLFGWVTKFLTGYDDTPINEEEEDELTEEVEGAIDDSNTDTTTEDTTMGEAATDDTTGTTEGTTTGATDVTTTPPTDGTTTPPATGADTITPTPAQ